MGEKQIPESWMGREVHLLDKQDDEVTEGELIEVNDIGAVLRVAHSVEATDDRPAFNFRTVNFYPWSSVRFMYVDEGELEIISGEEDS